MCKSKDKTLYEFENDSWPPLLIQQCFHGNTVFVKMIKNKVTKQIVNCLRNIKITQNFLSRIRIRINKIACIAWIKLYVFTSPT
ncbi:hypothetical protein CEV08_00080 [Bartonella tribocorum]|uniref:Uncharacterized protein n=1 Tax=Bartonella tribocorum TaxID=85701 RepID=A0A2M6UXX0_9HYPH|nr:hypothetical protein CEV08_00080 [Bartonella tribocorum]